MTETLVRRGRLNGREAIAVLSRNLALAEVTWQAAVYVRDVRSYRGIGEAFRLMDVRPDSERLLGTLNRVDGETIVTAQFDIVAEAVARGWQRGLATDI
jgi:hypothetical protein